MNKIERFVYDIVKSSPWWKNSFRNIYQKCFDLMPRKKNFFYGQIDVKQGYFFGFHDISPISDDECKVLANKPTVYLTMPKPSDSLEVGFFNFKNGKIHEYISCSISQAWNHHKGCRLQWLSDIEFIFNNSYNGKLASTIYNIETSVEKIIEFPIDTVHRKNRIATSFSYERLEKLMPGYGYPYSDESYLESNVPENTGLFLIDLEGNTRKLLVSLRELVEEQNNSNLFNYRHYVTHSEFSKDGRYISFLHRWVGDDVMKRWSRLIVYDLNNRSFFELPTSGMVSHYVWNNLNQIIAYCGVNGVDGHFLFDIPNVSTHKHIAPKILNSDGHQSFISDETFITDTYPDKYRMAKLYSVNIPNESVDLIASVYSPKKYQSIFPYKHIACDLHPRVSPLGNYVCFDTVFPGIRSIAVMKMN
jgi:hypothetical protein